MELVSDGFYRRQRGVGYWWRKFICTPISGSPIDFISCFRVHFA
jgi:hypothetical protein